MLLALKGARAAANIPQCTGRHPITKNANSAKGENPVLGIRFFYDG